MRITTFKGDKNAADLVEGMRHERFLIPVVFSPVQIAVNQTRGHFILPCSARHVSVVERNSVQYRAVLNLS